MCVTLDNIIERLLGYLHTFQCGIEVEFISDD